MLKQLIERISLLEDKSDSEENLNFHVTVWLLKELGYEERLFNFEHPICRDSKKNKHADIFIPVKPGKAMFVETKKYSKNLDEEDIIQLAEYITINEHKSGAFVKMHKRQLSDHSQKGRLLPTIQGKVKNKRNLFNTNFSIE